MRQRVQADLQRHRQQSGDKRRGGERHQPAERQPGGDPGEGQRRDLHGVGGEDEPRRGAQ